MTDTEYNNQLDVIALEALKCILNNDSMITNYSANVCSILAYDHAFHMLKTREKCIR